MQCLVELRCCILQVKMELVRYSRAVSREISGHTNSRVDIPIVSKSSRILHFLHVKSLHY